MLNTIVILLSITVYILYISFSAGAALLQIAEVHKEINTQVIDNVSTIHLIIMLSPLRLFCHF